MHIATLYILTVTFWLFKWWESAHVRQQWNLSCCKEALLYQFNVCFGVKASKITLKCTPTLQSVIEFITSDIFVSLQWKTLRETMAKTSPTLWALSWEKLSMSRMKLPQMRYSEGRRTKMYRWLTFHDLAAIIT